MNKNQHLFACISASGLNEQKPASLCLYFGQLRTESRKHYNLELTNKENNKAMNLAVSSRENVLLSLKFLQSSMLYVQFISQNLDTLRLSTDNLGLANLE